MATASPVSLILAALMLLASCTMPGKHKPVPVNAPQAAEQCQAQPDLAWCRK